MKLFNAEMYTPPVEQQSVADKVIDKFSGMSEDMALKKDDFEGKLVKAAKTGEDVDILAANRAMSEYYLQAALSTKVASKASQAIDKITNLQ
jgi:type III secretion system YscI/HrpB-like protein